MAGLQVLRLVRVKIWLSKSLVKKHTLSKPLNLLYIKIVCSLSYETLGGATGGNIQFLPFYSLLLALGNPTVNYFRQNSCIPRQNLGKKRRLLKTSFL